MATINRPPILQQFNLASVLRWMQQTSDNIARINSVGNLDLTMTVSQSIGTGATVAAQWNNQVSANGSLSWSATNPSRIICQDAGTVLVTASVVFQTAGAGQERWIWRNGGQGVFAADYWGDSLGQSGNLAAMIPVSAGDYLEVFVTQASGGPISLYAPANRIQARYIT